MRGRMHIYGKERLSVWMVNDEHEKSAKTVPNNTHKFHGFHFSLSFKADGVMQISFKIKRVGLNIVSISLISLHVNYTFIQE